MDGKKINLLPAWKWLLQERSSPWHSKVGQTMGEGQLLTEVEEWFTVAGR